MKTINIYTDGGSRGNPGQAALGVYVEGDGTILGKIGERLGIATNNFAEYSAILRGLDFLLEKQEILDSNTKVNFFMDSQLAYSQIVGIYKIKSATLRSLLFKIREKELLVGIPISYNFVPRERNKQADKLVNLALDNKLQLE